MSKSIQAEVTKRKERGKARVKQTAEVFTPMELCKSMVRDLSKEKLQNPKTRYIDNSCGDGNFLVALLEVLTQEYGHDREQVLNYQLYGVDLMPDNIVTVRKRLGIEPGTPAWDHIVCADALAYDYSFTAPETQSSMTEEAGVR
jgi:type I restriction-modification system DNA methylase subunit